ncbi:MAG: hypothetical protein EBR88_08045, partial [Betaproteobacteria bacterium]|nr:hypothetical protein [Betaproteobacteria bacterium]
PWGASAAGNHVFHSQRAAQWRLCGGVDKSVDTVRMVGCIPSFGGDLTIMNAPRHGGVVPGVRPMI